MTGSTGANDGETATEYDVSGVRAAAEEIVADGGRHHREIDIGGAVVVLDWDMTEHLLDVTVHVTDEDRVENPAADRMGDAGHALDMLQADLDRAFYRAMGYDREDYGNRAGYERHRRSVGTVFDGAITNPTWTPEADGDARARA